VLDRGGERAVAALAAAQLRHCWDVTLADSWPALRRVLDEDVRHRAAQAARSGFATILADLHPNLRWDGTRLERDAVGLAAVQEHPPRSGSAKYLRAKVCRLTPQHPRAVPGSGGFTPR
jgi:hypothetical protein